MLSLIDEEEKNLSPKNPNWKKKRGRSRKTDKKEESSPPKQLNCKRRRGGGPRKIGKKEENLPLKKLKYKRKRGGPRKIIKKKQKLLVETEEQEEQEKKAKIRVIRIRTAADPDATEPSSDEEDDKTRRVDQSKVFIQEIRIPTYCCCSEKKKKKMGESMKFVLPDEVPRRERSRRAITRRVDVHSISSSSSFQLNVEESADSASPLAWVPGPIPDFRDFIDIDIQSLLNFFAN